MEENKRLNIDLSKFKIKVTGKHLNNAKNDYIEFCEMLAELDFELVSDYIGALKKVDIIYQLNDCIKLNITPDKFKRTYRTIINFKNNLKNNGDEFVKFVDLTSKNFLIAKIKTFDDGEINIDINSYNHFNKSRQNTYDYCKEKGYKILSSYIGNDSKILIDFNCGHDPHWIRSSDLKQDKKCPVCDESKGERIIRKHLEKNNIDFIQEYRFEGCKYKLPLPFDFYIPSKNLIIEFDGEQHYKPISYFGGKKTFRSTQIRDKIKNDYCKENNINLLRIPYYELSNVEDILDKEFERLKN